MISTKLIGLAFLLMFTTVNAERSLAVGIDDILKGYADDVKKSNHGFKDFDAKEGRDFYFAEQKLKDGKTASCAECHTKDPTKTGKARTGKAIEPMAPVANAKRFTDRAKVEKWFKRNCNDVYERACTPLEKGNFIKFMQSVK